VLGQAFDPTVDGNISTRYMHSHIHCHANQGAKPLCDFSTAEIARGCVSADTMFDMNTRSIRRNTYFSKPLSVVFDTDRLGPGGDALTVMQSGSCASTNLTKEQLNEEAGKRQRLQAVLERSKKPEREAGTIQPEIHRRPSELLNTDTQNNVPTGRLPPRHPMSPVFNPLSGRKTPSPIPAGQTPTSLQAHSSIAVQPSTNPHQKLDMSKQFFGVDMVSTSKPPTPRGTPPTVTPTLSQTQLNTHPEPQDPHSGRAAPLISFGVPASHNSTASSVLFNSMSDPCQSTQSQTNDPSASVYGHGLKVPSLDLAKAGITPNTQAASDAVVSTPGSVFTGMETVSDAGSDPAPVMGDTSRMVIATSRSMYTTRPPSPSVNSVTAHTPIITLSEPVIQEISDVDIEAEYEATIEEECSEIVYLVQERRKKEILRQVLCRWQTSSASKVARHAQMSDNLVLIISLHRWNNMYRRNLLRKKALMDNILQMDSSYSSIGAKMQKGVLSGLTYDSLPAVKELINRTQKNEKKQQQLMLTQVHANVVQLMKFSDCDQPTALQVLRMHSQILLRRPSICTLVGPGLYATQAAAVHSYFYGSRVDKRDVFHVAASSSVWNQSLFLKVGLCSPDRQQDTLCAKILRTLMCDSAHDQSSHGMLGKWTENVQVVAKPNGSPIVRSVSVAAVDLFSTNACVPAENHGLQCAVIILPTNWHLAVADGTLKSYSARLRALIFQACQQQFPVVFVTCECEAELANVDANCVPGSGVNIWDECLTLCPISAMHKIPSACTYTDREDLLDMHRCQKENIFTRHLRRVFQDVCGVNWASQEAGSLMYSIVRGIFHITTQHELYNRDRLDMVGSLPDICCNVLDRALHLLSAHVPAVPLIHKLDALTWMKDCMIDQLWRRKPESSDAENFTVRCLNYGINTFAGSAAHTAPTLSLQLLESLAESANNTLQLCKAALTSRLHFISSASDTLSLLDFPAPEFCVAAGSEPSKPCNLYLFGAIFANDTGEFNNCLPLNWKQVTKDVLTACLRKMDMLAFPAVDDYNDIVFAAGMDEHQRRQYCLETVVQFTQKYLYKLQKIGYNTSKLETLLLCVDQFPQTSALAIKLLTDRICRAVIQMISSRVDELADISGSPTAHVIYLVCNTVQESLDRIWGAGSATEEMANPCDSRGTLPHSFQKQKRKSSDPEDFVLHKFALSGYVVDGRINAKKPRPDTTVPKAATVNIIPELLADIENERVKESSLQKLLECALTPTSWCPENSTRTPSDTPSRSLKRNVVELGEAESEFGHGNTSSTEFDIDEGALFTHEEDLAREDVQVFLSSRPRDVMTLIEMMRMEREMGMEMLRQL
jgi:hypothetical protein